MWTPKAFAAVPTRKYKIAIVPKGLDNPVFALAKLGLEERASELGDVEPIFTAGATTNTELDINVLEGLVSSKVDAIGISCNDPVAYIPVINKAIANGICVMCWDSDAPESNRVCFYGVNSYHGRPEHGPRNEQTAPWARQRRHYQWRPVCPQLEPTHQGREVGAGPGHHSPQPRVHDGRHPDGGRRHGGRHQSYPNPQRASSWSAAGPCSPAKAPPRCSTKHKGKIKVESFDPLASVVTYLRDGIVQSVWTQDYWGWGYESTTILYSLLKGGAWHETIPQPSHNVLPSDWKALAGALGRDDRDLRGSGQGLG